MNQLAHHWVRKLEDSRKPAYLTIPDLIEEDLASGRLRPRDRLPGLRDLADLLGLNYTTVARAYAEARKRDLLDSRAGSGTFVRGRTQTLPLAGGSSVEMSMNMPPEPPALAARLRASAASLMERADPFPVAALSGFRRHGGGSCCGTRVAQGAHSRCRCRYRARLSRHSWRARRAGLAACAAR